MTFVDSSVWIDLFADRHTPETLHLQLLARERRPILVGDLVLAEVLQGVRETEAFDRTLARMSLFDQISVCDPATAIAAARHFRTLRGLGITVRKTIDTLIATRCILDDVALLYRDRDYDPFVRHLGLRPALYSSSRVS
jgi:predicted nucleic acid-binding protein